MKRPFIRWKSFVDLVGHAPFGRLTVVSFVGFNDRHRSTWLVVCSCGKSFVTLGNSLLSGKTKSCGCLGKSKIAARNRLGKGIKRGPRNITT
jgi:hypothetical protein